MCWSSQASASTRSSGAPERPATTKRRGAAAAGAASRPRGHERGVHLVEHDLTVDHALAHVAARREVVHDVEQHLFEDGPQATGAGAAEQRLVGDGAEGVVGELQLDVFELEELLVLLHQRVLRLDQDPDQGFLVERRHGADHREATDELGDEAELQQVLGEDLREDLRRAPLVDLRMSAPKPTPFDAEPTLDDLLDPGEGAAADEEDVRGVDLDELLVRVLAPALRRHRGRGALEDLEQRLLHALAGDVTRDRRVLALAGDLVDLVDVDDPGLGLLDVVVGGLDQLEEDVLDVLAHVARLGERGGVGDGERHVEHAGQGLGQQRLAAAGGADQQDVGLGQLDVVVVRGAELHPLVVVVDGDREDLLRVVLTDDVVVQELEDLTRLGQLVEAQLGGLGELLLDDLVAEVDALVADVDPGTGDQLLDLLLRLAAEGALQQLAPVSELRHVSSPVLPVLSWPG